jgi:hypothetical protein
MEITAQVLANLGDRQALLLLRGNPVLVKTSGPLEEGSEIQVNMTRQGRSSGVNLVSMNSLKGDLILGKLSGNLMIGHKPISEWMGTIWDALRLADRRILDVILKIVPLDEKTNPFSIPTFDKQKGGLPPDRIKGLLLDRGLNYESKIVRWASGPESHLQEKAAFYLNDTKGLAFALQKMLRALKISQPKLQSDVLSLLVKIEEGFQRIEQQQFLNSVARRNEDFLTLPFPVEFQKERTTVTIMLGKKAKGRKKGKEKEKREVVFLLELQALGKVRIDAFLNSKSISIKIGIAEEDLVPFVKPFLPELKERLDSSGFQVQSLDCFHIKNPDDEEPFLKGISPDGEIPLIDLLI